MCPRCNQVLHRSRARNPLDHLRKWWSPRRLFRCAGCGWRGWLLPLDVSGPHASSTDGSPAIDLKALDREWARRRGRRDDSGDQ